MKTERLRNFQEMLETAIAIKPKTVAVVYPNNSETLSAITEASVLMKTRFALYGDESALKTAASTLPEDVRSRIRMVAANGAGEALALAIDAVRKGEADILMKGGIDTATMMRGVLSEQSGLKIGRLLSDIFVLEYPSRIENQLIMITDGGMTLAPDLKNKVELINNAAEVAHALGNENPRVAVLSATEFVMPNLQSTLDAAALSKMNERGQIKGCVVDGPLALDNALSMEAAEEKGINSPVAGRAEILVAANIESANSLAKSTTYFANLRLAHVIVGASVPILIPSRSDKSEAKLLSIALGTIMSDYSARN